MATIAPKREAVSVILKGNGGFSAVLYTYPNGFRFALNHRGLSVEIPRGAYLQPFDGSAFQVIQTCAEAALNGAVQLSVKIPTATNADIIKAAKA